MKDAQVMSTMAFDAARARMSDSRIAALENGTSFFCMCSRMGFLFCFFVICKLLQN